MRTRAAGAGPGIIALHGAPQPRRLHAHDWIGLRIEVFAALEGFDADRIALDAGAVPCERGLDHEAQERHQLRRGAEILARHDARKLGAHLIRARHGQTADRAWAWRRRPLRGRTAPDGSIAVAPWRLCRTVTGQSVSIVIEGRALRDGISSAPANSYCRAGAGTVRLKAPQAGGRLLPRAMHTRDARLERAVEGAAVDQQILAR